MATSDFTPLDVKAMRQARGLTQEQLGRILSVTQKRIARIEKSPGAVSARQLQKIWGALGFSVKAERDISWLSPLSSNDKDASSVYIAHHRTLPFFKVGKADDVKRRLAGIGGDVDLPSATRLVFRCVSDAFRAETLLHRAFAEWRVSQDDALSAGLPSSGGTEWFRAECRARFDGFVRANHDLIGLAEHH